MAGAHRIARILVPVDGSDCSRAAAEHAVWLAQVHGAESEKTDSVCFRGTGRS